MRRKHALSILSVSSLALLAVSPALALDIQATFDATFTAAQKSTLQSVVSFFNTKYTDATTIKIQFDNVNTGLGMSSTFGSNVTYADYHAALIAHNSGNSVDTTALAKLASLPFGGSSLRVTTALGRTLGLTNFNVIDSTISLNSGLCFTGHASPVAGKYDLWAVAAHELDEALGSSSGVGGTFTAADLFRYDGSGNRSFTASSSQHAYFSLDGTTLLEEYNAFQHGGGDWGDWVVHTPGQVQDFQGTPGGVVNYGIGETSLEDAIGYNTTAVPEPSTIAVFALGGVAFLRRRKRA